MSTDDSFLARWARRKHAAAANARSQPEREDAGDETFAEPAAPSLPVGEGEPFVDTAGLPPIETLGAGSDIRPFMADGVPADLTRAALRRAWSADPAIRDFIGLSENSWDFNDPRGVPGFGALTTEDARRLLTQVTQETGAPGLPDPAAERLADDRAPAPDGRSQGRSDTDQTEGEELRRSLLLRRHGGALPD
jgi:uncharacterized protein DUF3306